VLLQGAATWSKLWQNTYNKLAMLLASVSSSIFPVTSGTDMASAWILTLPLSDDPDNPTSSPRLLLTHSWSLQVTIKSPPQNYMTLIRFVYCFSALFIFDCFFVVHFQLLFFGFKRVLYCQILSECKTC
jgi:hypothetical protein